MILSFFQFQAEKDDLIKEFGFSRDDFMKKDLSTWLSLNPVFSCAKQAFSSKTDNDRYYIITTKQG